MLARFLARIAFLVAAYDCLAALVPSPWMLSGWFSKSFAACWFSFVAFFEFAAPPGGYCLVGRCESRVLSVVAGGCFVALVKLFWLALSARPPARTASPPLPPSTRSTERDALRLREAGGCFCLAAALEDCLYF